VAGEFVIYAYTLDDVPDKTYLALGEVQGWEGEDNTRSDSRITVRWYRTDPNIFGCNSRYTPAKHSNSEEPYLDQIERATIVKTGLRLTADGFFSKENGSLEQVKQFLRDTKGLYTVTAPPEVAAKKRPKKRKRNN
jgi:hypothetical protein